MKHFCMVGFRKSRSAGDLNRKVLCVDSTSTPTGSLERN
jgi:hypothetical protein